VVLSHDVELAGITEYSGSDTALFETAVLLNNCDVPTVEFAELGVAFLDNFLPAGDVEKSGDFLIDVPFPQRARQGNDMFARVIRDEKPGCGLQFLGRLRDVTQLEMCNPARE